jgi:hypothetical protein
VVEGEAEQATLGSMGQQAVSFKPPQQLQLWQLAMLCITQMQYLCALEAVEQLEQAAAQHKVQLQQRAAVGQPSGAEAGAEVEPCHNPLAQACGFPRNQWL